jgi:anti-sigma B factor antagonist
MLTCKRQDSGSVVVVALAGNLDALTVGGIKAEVERIVSERAKACVLDLGGVLLVDSTGVGSIISLFKRLRAHGGDLKVAGVNGQPKEIFDLLRLERALDMHPNVAAAIAKFR